MFQDKRFQTGRMSVYPDIHNLLLLSVLFDVSLDQLVKGDVEKMKENRTLLEINKYTKVMLFFMLLTLISVGPSLFYPVIGD